MDYSDFKRYAESINGTIFRPQRRTSGALNHRMYDPSPMMAFAKGVTRALDRQILEEARKTKIGLIKYDGDISASTEVLF